MKFEDMGLKPDVRITPIKISDGVELEVLNYLSVADKTNLISFIVDSALDDNTGCFSPLRVEVYFAIAICKWYAGIEFSIDDLTHVDVTYDLLDNNGIINSILRAIPEDELNFIQDLVQETIEDIARYNSSAAGIIRTASVDAGNLDGQLTELLGKIKDGEGLETLEAIKNVVGID